MDLKRSWMFVPGHRQRMIDKALDLKTDAIMLDIEDGVAPTEKDTARKLIGEALERERSPRSPIRFVRINDVGHERMDADLEAVLRPGLDGLVLPKVETAEEVIKVASILQDREPKLRIESGSVKLLIAIESPRGLLNAPAIAACSPRIIGLMFGAEDYGRELGLPTVREGEARDLIYARSAMVVATASAHVQAVDGVWVDLKDSEGLHGFARQSRRLGFSGMSLIHPSQIDPINNVFSPTPEEVDYAMQVVKAFEEAAARGDGSISFGGQLIDRPIVERARRALEMAKMLGIAAQSST
ncbi:MAG: CoA ester lyase [Candidatus Binatia bacterium]|jgi:citrate lyase subunit beta/citryl-CoA lyase|nr:CoA ester lyase [Candidatus Binatia bacterium]